MAQGVKRKIRLKSSYVEGYLAALGLVLQEDKAAFLNLSSSTYGRLVKGTISPGEDTIGAVLSAFAEKGVGFDQLFELVEEVPV